MSDGAAQIAVNYPIPTKTKEHMAVTIAGY